VKARRRGVKEQSSTKVEGGPLANSCKKTNSSICKVKEWEVRKQGSAKVEKETVNRLQEGEPPAPKG